LKREPPFDLPGDTTEAIPFEIKVLKPGEYSAQLHIFVGDPYLREIVLEVKGIAKGAVSPENLSSR
jgi:hypothetical protein